MVIPIAILFIVLIAIAIVGAVILGIDRWTDFLDAS